MSVFNDAAPANPLDLLVGEGKKFATIEDLAKGKIEADRTIEDRNREAAELRAEMERLRLENEIYKRQPVREPEARTTEREPTRPVEEEPAEDLATRIRKELQAATEEERKNQNLAHVVNRLEDIYGERAGEILRNKAAELGVSVKFLQDVAASSPKAFYAQIGLTDSPTQTATTVRSDVNTEAVNAQSSQGVKQGTYHYYEELRRNDPKRYFSPQVQNEMFLNAKKLGDNFYNR